MTRYEAIKHLSEWLDEKMWRCFGETDREALRMAIEALKAEPIRCGECENYIDRRCIEANHHVAAHQNCVK